MIRSPFPGMDPYLERHWRDVHARLVLGACNAIQPRLGGDLRARIDERLVVESALEARRAIHPDVRVFERGVSGRPVEPAVGVGVAEPLVVSLEIEPVGERFVQIIDVASGGRVITVIEFLSPTNKMPGDGQIKYRKKQQECLDADINLVEVDLTRTGEREFLYPVVNLPRAYQTTYLACVYRGFGFHRCEFYRMPLRERLPAIRIPLRPTDADVALDIQHLVEQAYADGRYDDIDYREPCRPPLDPDDVAWADELLRATGCDRARGDPAP
ncbi:MAG: DUF4058 family protein [Candidatus Rokubacteria bacterium]|nr:DUF4058 family protein [Candidatus Rokubacteria bacterium]